MRASSPSSTGPGPRTTWSRSSPGASYTLDGKYTLGGSLRTDGSSRFGPNDRWGVFPAVSASWLISEESGIRGGFFDFLKLRASYGLTGNRPSRLPLPGPGDERQLRRHPRHRAPTTWRTPTSSGRPTAQFNVGMDMAFAKGRVSLTADWYQKKTRDLLLDRPITATSGLSPAYSITWAT